MSNALIKAAQKVRWLVDDRGVRRDLRPSERLVLVALADDARDALGGRSRLGPAEIRARTGCSERMVRYAFSALQAGGHITREDAVPGAVAVTVVHPFAGVKSRVAPLQPVAGEGCNPLQGGGATHCTPHSVYNDDRPRTHSPLASAREAVFEDFAGPVAEVVSAPPAPPPLPTPAQREFDPVNQVFAAWDAWRDRAGLPGPVTRNAARRVAVARAIEANGIGKVLMMIDTVERGVRAGQFRRRNDAGQDSIWATFDAAFEVGHAAGLNLLARLLDGEFGAVESRVERMPEQAPERAEQPQHADEPDPSRRLRAAMRARLGDALARQWIDPLQLRWERDGSLLVIAPGAFQADWVNSHYAGQLRSAAGGAMVRIVERERV